MEKLSVVIITYNEENKIARCIDSIQSVADEIVVLDSYSSDLTVPVAREKGAKVWQEPFRGYIEQKNRAVELASHNFILSIDADEVADGILLAAIETAKRSSFAYSAYRMKRCTNHCGRFIRHGAWYPDRKIRLFDKRLAQWGGLNPHDKVVFKKPVAVKELPGELQHYSYTTIEEHKMQNERFSSIVAQSYYNAGKRTNIFRIFINPFWTFVYGYLLRTGFVNGRQGFVIALHQSGYTFLKHKKLFLLQHGRSWNNTSDIQTAANTDRLPGNISTHVGGKEKSYIRHIFRRRKTA